MSKLASSDFRILGLFKRRWNPRAFADRPVDRETLHSLFEAARWSQSCNNEQPWRFVFAFRSDAVWHETLGSCLAAGNAWAKEAPVLGLSVAKTAFSSNNHPNRTAAYDVGGAMMAFIIQATAMHLYVHQMAGFDVNSARQVAGVPEGFDPIAMFALGYMGDPDFLSPELKAREIAPRTRKKLDEFVFGSQWNHPAL